MSYLRPVESRPQSRQFDCGPGSSCAGSPQPSATVSFGEHYLEEDEDEESVSRQAVQSQTLPGRMRTGVAGFSRFGGLSQGPCQLWPPTLDRPQPRPWRLNFGGIGQAPALRPDVACPGPARVATVRCQRPIQCPAIPTLRCYWHVDGVPFEYVSAVGRVGPGRTFQVIRRLTGRQQSFIPAVRDALSAFIGNCTRFGMPIEAILTAGTLVCRCAWGPNRTPGTRLSNHSFGDAVDVVGVRWLEQGRPQSSLRETIVHNWRNPEQRPLLLRLNACLRLSFPVVIDYWRADHRDHFHCDLAQGGVRNPRGATTLKFVQEALSWVTGRELSVTGAWDAATQQALREFSRVPTLPQRGVALNQILNRLFERVASGQRVN